MQVTTQFAAPGSLDDLSPWDTDLVTLAARMPLFVESVPKEGFSGVIALYGALERAQITRNSKEEQAIELRMNRAVRLLEGLLQAKPNVESLAAGIVNEPSMAVDDYRAYFQCCQKEAKLVFRKPIASMGFPVVCKQFGFVARWVIYRPFNQAVLRDGRVTFAIANPGGDQGSVIHSSLHGEIAEGFNRAVDAARNVASKLLSDQERDATGGLEDLIVWLDTDDSFLLDGSGKRFSKWIGAPSWDGPSGSLALAIALLQAWTNEPRDTTGWLVSGDLVCLEGTWFSASVGYSNMKNELTELCGRTLLGSFASVGDEENAHGMTLSSIWQQFLDKPTPRIEPLTRTIARLDTLNNGMRHTDFLTETINFVRIEKKQREFGSKKEVSVGESGESDRTTKTKRRDRAATDDHEQPQHLKDENQKSIGWKEFVDEVLKSDFRTRPLPIILSAGPGMGKTFAAMRLAIQQGEIWRNAVLAGEEGERPHYPIFLPLNNIKGNAVGDLISAMEHASGVHFKSLLREHLLLVLDARDQADAVGVRIRPLLEELAKQMDSGRTLSVVITTRPTRRDYLWSPGEFGRFDIGCVEFWQSEFSSQGLDRFLEVRLPNDPDLRDAIKSVARKPRGTQMRITVPIIAEYVAEMASDAKARSNEVFLTRLKQGLSAYELYSAIVQRRLKYGIEQSQCRATNEYLLSDLVRLLGFLSAEVWDSHAGRNLFTEERLKQVIREVKRFFSGLTDLTDSDLIQILRFSGLFELFQETGQACFAHRSLLEFVRASWMVNLYKLRGGANYQFPEGVQGPLRSLNDSSTANSTNFYVCSLDRLINQKTWDPQWSEVLCFFASYLADVDEGQGLGSALVPFLQRVQGKHDCMIQSRLNVALMCLRQAWFLYGDEAVVGVSEDLLTWSHEVRKKLTRADSWRLIPFRGAVIHWFSANDEEFPVPWFVNDLRPDVRSISPFVMSTLIDRLKSEEDRDLRRYLAVAIGAWSSHGTREMLKTLIDRLETEENAFARRALARAIGAWSSHATPGMLQKLFDRLQNEEDADVGFLVTEDNWVVRDSLAEAIGAWSSHGTPEMLEKLIDRLETEKIDYVRRALARAIGAWSSHGNPTMLQKLIDRLVTEDDLGVSSALAEAIGAWSSHATPAMLQTLINRLETEDVANVRLSLARVIGTWSSHGNPTMLETLIDQLKTEKSEDVRPRLARAIGAWSSHGNPRMLQTLIDRLETEGDADVRETLAQAIGAWSSHGSPAMLQTLIDRLETEGGADVGGALAEAIGAWSSHGTREMLETLIDRLVTEDDLGVSSALAEAIGDWSSRRFFPKEHPFNPPANGALSMAELADCGTERYSQSI